MIPEEWGGDTMFVNVSARTGQGIDQLLETILLQAEVLDLKAPQTGPAVGVVLESSIEKGRGAVATVLVKRGTLRAGDPIIAGQEFGRVRALFDATGKQVDEAGPAVPVAGARPVRTRRTRATTCSCVESERKAREVALYRQGKFRDVRLATAAKKMRGRVLAAGRATVSETVQLIVKADVQGSAEALRDALSKLGNDEVSGQGHRERRRRHHRVGRDARGRFARAHHRLQRARRHRGARRASRTRASTSATTASSTRRSTT